MTDCFIKGIFPANYMKNAFFHSTILDFHNEFGKKISRKMIKRTNQQKILCN